jgi:hypothetical protein
MDLGCDAHGNRLEPVAELRHGEMKTGMRITFTVLSGWLVLCGATVEQVKVQDASELTKQVQNPLATLVTLPFQANHNTDVAEDGLRFQLNFRFPLASG